MAASTADEAAPEEERAAHVTAHSTSGDRVVFIESGNTEGWIATDSTVDLSR